MNCAGAAPAAGSGGRPRRYNPPDCNPRDCLSPDPGMPLSHLASVQDIARFGEIIDVRSPGEYSDDHIPGAGNYPVLDDQERAEIGTLNAQVSPFAARRRGAALTARNIARHVETAFCARDPGWHPLVYCWRGGKRSRSLALVLSEVGWEVSILQGGYKAYRRHVVESLAV